MEQGNALGYALFAMPGQATLVRTAAGRLFTVDRPIDEVDEALGGSTELFAQASELREQVVHDATPRASTTACRVAGTGRLADAMAEALRCERVGHFADVGSMEVGRQTGGVLVFAQDNRDEDQMEQWVTAARERSATYLMAHIEHETVSVGPLGVGVLASDAVDAFRRRLVSSRHAAYFSALAAPPVAGGSPLDGNDLRWVALLTVAEIQTFLATGNSQLLFREMVVRPLTRGVEWHVVLPMPDRIRMTSEVTQLWTAAGLPHGLDALHDRRTGPIVHARPVPHHPSVPSGLVTYQAFTGQLARVYPWSNSQVCGGSSFLSEDDARYASMGEAVERYCGNLIDPGRIRRASFAELRAGGEDAVDPEDLVLYSDEQYATAGFPFEPLTRDSKIGWIDGRDLDGAPVWLPGSMTYVNWHVGPYRADPAYHAHHYAGIAAGADLAGAVLGGLEEIVERDVTMIWWTNRHPLPTLDVSGTAVEEVVEESERLGQRLSFIALPNQFAIPVIVAILWNDADALLNVGFGCKPDPVHAALKAATEAFTLQEGSRDLDNPDGLYRKGAIEAIVSDRFLKPWRADRRYLDDYHPQFRDVNVLLCQQQLLLDPRAQEAVRPWLTTSVQGHLEDVERPDEHSLPAYRERLERHGYRVLYADITSPDIELADVHVARTLVPGLVGNFPAAFPLLGRRRIQDAPVELGWRPRPLATDELNFWPLPHA